MAILRQPINEQATTREDYPPVPLGTIVGVEVSETEPTNPLTEIWIKPSEGNQDFVVEQGTNGNWNYRKWNSGVAECWLKSPLQKTVSAVSLMGGYYATITDVKLPTNLFNATPNLDSVRGAIGNGLGFGDGVARSTTDTSLSIWGNQSSTTATIKYVKAIGTWK